MTDCLVRRANDTDADAIASLLRQLGYPTESCDVPSRLARMAAAGSHAVALVAVRDRNVVGLATGHVLTVVNRGNDVAWLTALVVDESARGSGVGRALVRAVEDFAREAGCERLSVTSHEHRQEAHEFYLRLGLEYTGRRFGKALTP